MKNSYCESDGKLSIVKYAQSHSLGIQSYQFQQYALGFVSKGKKYLYQGDTKIDAGNIFFLTPGAHYI